MKVLLFTLLLCTAGMSISYQDIAPIISKHCVGCHKGPFLDLQSFPFYSDAIEDQRLLVAEMIRRAKMRDLKRMPLPPIFEFIANKDGASRLGWRV